MTFLTKDLVRVLVCLEDMLEVGIFIQFFSSKFWTKKRVNKRCVL